MWRPGLAEARRLGYRMPLGRVAAVGTGVGIVALVLYELSAVSLGAFAQRVGAGLAVAAASMVSGLLIGLVFGVPRALSQDTEIGSERYGPNTNLEQISDWLTKILVGVGLTQFRAIGDAAGRLFTNVAPLFGSPDDVAFAGSLIVLFSALGFLLGWLVARLVLPVAMSTTDREQREVEEKLQQAREAAAGGDPERAAELRLEVADQMLDPATLARSYERERRSPSSAQRTARMEAIVASARLLGTSGLSRDDVRRMFASGADGDRVVALAAMQANPALADVDAILEAIGNSRSAFEQYHALLALDAVKEQLTANQRRAAQDVIAQQRTPGGHITQDDPDRWVVSGRLLEFLQAVQGRR
jgi:hypothetical protein